MLLSWAAKRAIIARIQAWADMHGDPDDVLYGVQVAYSLPPEPDRVCVYGGRVRSTRTQALAEHRAAVREDITVEVRIRVQELADDIESVERRAEQIAGVIAEAVAADPRITLGSILVAATDADPTIITPGPEPSITANVGLTVALSMITGGA